MKRNPLPFYLTGWFYLLLALWTVLFALLERGVFTSVNQLNRDIIHEFLPADRSQPAVKWLSTDFNASTWPNIERLIQSHPSSPVVFLGTPSSELIDALNLMPQVVSGKTKIFIAGGENASTQIKGGSTNWLMDWSVNWYRFEKLAKVNLLDNAIIHYVLMPNKQFDGLPVIFKSQDNFYVSILGAVASWPELAAKNFELDLQVSLADEHRTRYFGFGGKVFTAGKPRAAVSLDAYLSGRDGAKAQLLILDNQQVPMNAQWIRAVEQLVASKGIYQSTAFYFLPALLTIGMLVILWFCQRLKLKLQAILLIGFVTIALVIQYIALTQAQWFSILPMLCFVLTNWLVMLGYRQESEVLERVYQRHNKLLGDAIGVFYQAQKINKVQPLLSETIANQALVEKVFDVALQAETNNNKPLAKSLLTWINNSGVEHEGSAERLNKMTPETEQSATTETPSLDSTMVIGPGQTNPNTLSNIAIPVSHFGRYEVEGILGKGAMGIVYQGVDPKINRHVAIKTLQLGDAIEADKLEENKARFFREAETAGNLSHANIVTIYDVGEEGELGYIAMDLLTGAPLSEFVKPESRLPAPFVYQLMIQITDALEYAHRQNVVHRDIKPGNIILDDEIQRVTVTDFGIAYVADNSKTRTGTIMGSPYYMSPEQVLGDRVDGRSDIFSLGVTFYQLLSGHLPFNGESIASVAYHITKTKHQSVRQWDSKLPASAARITNKALQKEASKRYQTMGEFKQVLISALKRDFKKAPIV